LKSTDLIFEIPASKWFTYSFEENEDGMTSCEDDPTTPDVDECEGFTPTVIPVSDAGAALATAQSDMGKFAADDYLKTSYIGGQKGFEHTSNNAPIAKKMVPNFGATAAN